MPNEPIDLKQDRPHSARMYDYMLDGKSNYEVDRAAAEQVLRSNPHARKVAKANRAFMHRAARFLAETGIRQFLDIGTGIPTEPNLHQVAQEVNPAARVVYADNDPIVLANARALMSSTPEGRTAYVHADLTDPEAILNAPEVAATLDFAEPIAVSLIAVAHFVPGDRLYEIVDSLLAPLVPGSYLAMTHLTTDIDPEGVGATVRAAAQGGIELAPRDRDAVARFCAGLNLVEPGIVPLHRWRPEMEQPATYDATLPLYAAVARKP
ncbi:SAM-dependent methyltransferase [Nocardia sp. BMG51109]|uniref:SAM-dependent methyltransferase n=1 Tax=Nocardia sp. BMG51109 TaxID=1056816 RepID=UPI00046446F1|nr:SAM-dependent methyltransferase [Nocardia sp. BMG51109]